ncbi:Molybdopterin synthase catalytic subunit 2 [Armadillidium vulgare]|nr:Molybdopterin synthase catalytic subunit 2 [Armadillidium vulgare]
MNAKVPVTLLFFASARDFAGVSKQDYFLTPFTTTENILEEVSKDFPPLLKLKGSLIISINQEYFESDQEITIHSGDEVKMDFIKLTQDPLSVEEATNLASDASCGAVSIFIGTTRDHFEGKTVTRLEYEGI